MPYERLVTLISRKLAGEASTEELQELVDHLNKHPQDEPLLDILMQYWKHNPGPVTDSEEDLLNAHFKYIIDQAESEEEEEETTEQTLASFQKRPSGKIVLLKFITAATAAVMIVVSAYWLLNIKGPSSNGNKTNQVYAKPGVKTKLILPDGTTVWLNSGSRLTYNENFTGPIRSVELDGEAFFDVVKDAKHPFIVHTSNIDIRVLGTAFNVKSYESESTIEATLIRGLIEVTKKNEPQSAKILLRPHEKLVFNKEEKTLSVGSGKKDHTTIYPVRAISITPLPRNVPDTALTETSWVYNKLIFDGDSFNELARKMERWFNVHISFKDDRVAEYRFKGTFYNENLEQALQALQLTAPFEYKISDNKVEIFEK